MIKRLAAAAFIAMLTTSTVNAWTNRNHIYHHRRRTAEHVNLRKAAEANGYKKVSSLAIFPEFVPGLGVFYVKPETLPHGPLLLFDRKARLVATVYMIPVQDINDHKKLDLSGFRGRIDHVTFYFQSGHVLPHSGWRGALVASVSLRNPSLALYRCDRNCEKPSKCQRQDWDLSAKGDDLERAKALAVC